LFFLSSLTLRGLVMSHHVVADCEWVTEMDWERISRVEISNNISDGYFPTGLKKRTKKFQFFQPASIITFETEASRIKFVKAANFNSTFD
jgi:hypothetical protein